MNQTVTGCEQSSKNAKLKMVDRKLRSLLSSQQFCGLCLESEESCIWSTHVTFEIIVHGKVYIKCFKDIIFDVFHDVTHLPASSNICKQCTDKTLQSYIFIQKTRETAKVLDCYVSCLYKKTVSIDEKLDPIQYYGDKKCSIVLCSRYRNKLDKLVIKNQEEIGIEPVKLEDLASNGIDETNHETITTVFEDECVKSPETVSDDECIKSPEIVEGNRKDNCEIADYDFQYKFIKDKLKTSLKKKTNKKGKKKIGVLNKVTNKVASKLKVIKPIKTENNEYKCVECKVVMPTYKEWRKHWKTKHTQITSDNITNNPCCDVCLKTFCSNKYLLTHYKVHNRIKCKLCDEIVKDKEFRRHLKLNHIDNTHTCNYCEFVSVSETSLEEHVKHSHSHEGTNYCTEKQCERCLKNFSHEKFKEHPCIFKCSLCPEAPCLHEKYLTSYRDQVLKEAEGIRCADCEYVCQQKDNLIDHANKEHLNHRPYTCSVCLEKFFSTNEYTNHIKSHNVDTKYACEICNKQFDERKKLAWHNRKHKRSQQNKIKCTICSKEMFESTLNMHMKIHDSVESHSFTCESCGKSFAFKVRLDQHKMTHSDPIPCTLCGQLIKPMSMYLHLRRHKIRLNPALKKKPPKKPHNKKCEYCDYTTYCKDLLEIHVNKEHLKVKPHVCNVCGASYMSKYYLNQHTRVHTEEKKYNCPICDKSLRHKIGLKKHMMLHTGERPHICDICGEGYQTVTMLKYHMQKHSGKNEQCPLCGGMYYSIKHVRSHIKKCHWEFKDKKFDYKKVRGLTKEHYHIFQDRRKAIADDIYDDND